MSANQPKPRKAFQTVKKSSRLFDSADVILTMIFFGISGWVIGKARSAWVSGRRTWRSSKDIPGDSSAGSGMSGYSQVSSTGSLPANPPRLTPYFDVRDGSKRPQDKVAEGGTPKGSASRLFLQTDVHCKRCAKLLNWEELNKPYRVRLQSPKRKNDLLTRAKSESETTLRKLSRRGSFVPPKLPYRTIICFGDSNTWGYDPASRDRLDCRWPVILSSELGEGFRVIEEGLSGRTINKRDPKLMRSRGFSHSGLEHAPTVLSSHKPLDLVILYLGINDLKTHLNPNIEGIIKGMEKLLKTIMNLPVFREHKEKEITLNKRQGQILLMAPPTLRPCEQSTSLNWFGEKSVEVSAVLTPALEKLAKRMKVHFFDTSKIVQTSELDSRHFGPEMHRKLGAKVAERVRNIYTKV